MFDLSLIRWIVPYMRAYRWRLALLAVVSLAEVALGALTPWTLKLVVDNVLSGRPMPGWIAAVTSPLGHAHGLRCLAPSWPAASCCR